ncbi:hypothetical protein [Bacillus licheniformis]|uniref:hypothetical protein n=1 Tax=Bacillus licheniformis TaxID=1402 RepID=UPI002E2216B5|nr:hypothetical protein [Bacillus licheniformis]
MKNISNWIFTKFISSLIGVIVSPIVSAIVSKITTGSWISWFSQPVIITLLLIILVWFVICLIYRMITYRKNEQTLAYFLGVGGKKIYELPYKGVLWAIYGDLDVYGKVNIDTIYAREAAKCPKCRTELEETKTFLGSYKWECINCLNFKKTNKLSLYQESIKATKIAKSKFEENMKKS